MDELTRFRAALETDWPGFAEGRVEVALADAPAIVAEFWQHVGWSPALEAPWIDPRSSDAEAHLTEWIAEGRLEYAIDEGEDEPEPSAVATAWPVARSGLPARTRVLRRFDEGGDLTLWITDESAATDDPEVLRLSLRGEILASASRASRFLGASMARDLCERRRVMCVLAASDVRALGAPLWPSIAPDVLEVAPGVWLEADVSPGARSPHRLSARERDALERWLASLPPGRIEHVGARYESRPIEP